MGEKRKKVRRCPKREMASNALHLVVQLHRGHLLYRAKARMHMFVHQRLRRVPTVRRKGARNARGRKDNLAGSKKNSDSLATGQSQHVEGVRR